MKHPIPPSNLVRRAVLGAVLVALVLAGFASGRAAQGRSSDLEQKRERWMRMSEAERAQLRERYEQWKRMTPERREELAERARNLELFERGLYQAPPPKLKERFRGRSPEDCRRDMHRYMREHSSELSKHMREKLPPEKEDGR